MSESKPEGKSFGISKWLVQEAFGKVRDNKGAAGVDGQSIADFESDLQNNLYKIWNRMSSGTYFPPPVRAVEIPKAGGSGVRVLGVPTVADRVAQTVVAMFLEPAVEKVFHPDSYGYRPGRSAFDAVGVCRERCWKYDWVVDLDIKSFFDTVPHDRILAAVEKHTDQPWVLLYVRRWLQAPMRQPDGTLVARDRGTPQGSAISPLLANLFLHYAFDMWLARECPGVVFERYCDDVVVHCRTEAQACRVREAIGVRLAGFGMELHPDKTKVVYCKDGKRSGGYPHTEFTFLGYTFRARGAKGRGGEMFTSFLPAVSKAAKKAMGREIRSWRIGQRSDLDMKDLARRVNQVVRGWINYYGRFYKSELVLFLQRINKYLVHWLLHKYKRFRRSRRRAGRKLAEISQAYPGFFAHWRFGASPSGWTMGAV
jgi:RNA-directed DNA polymerase